MSSFRRGHTTAKKASKASIARTQRMREANSKLFDSFADAEDTDTMFVEGLVSLCESLGVDPASDVRVLVMFWKFRAETQATLTREEFVSGMTAAGCSSVAELKAALPVLVVEAYSKEHFKSFFKYVFEISRDGTESTLDYATVVLLLGIVYGTNAPASSHHLDKFIEFLNLTPEKRMRRDEWGQFRVFSEDVKADCSDYDEDGMGAWPGIYDDYVDWFKGEKK